MVQYVFKQYFQWGEFKYMKTRESLFSPSSTLTWSPPPPLSFLESFEAFWNGMVNVASCAVEQLLWKPQHEFPDYCVFLFNNRHMVALIYYFNVHFISLERRRWQKRKETFECVLYGTLTEVHYALKDTQNCPQQGCSHWQTPAQVLVVLGCVQHQQFLSWWNFILRAQCIESLHSFVMIPSQV